MINKRVKLWVLILVFILIVTGCSLNDIGKNEEKSQTEINEETGQTKINEEKFKVVTTVFAPNDWTKAILGSEINNWELTMLLDNGVDLHNYQPTAEDIARLSSCDLFIYVGGHSDAWVEDALKVANNDEMTVIRLMDVLSERLHYEEFIEGMEEHDHDHGHESHEDEAHDDHDHGHEGHEDEAHDDHDHGHESHEDEAHDDHDHGHEGHEDEAHDDHDHGHEGHEDEAHDDHDHHANEADEHIWLSLKNAILSSDAIKEAIVSIDPENESIYSSNAKAYIDEMNALHMDYSNMVKGSDISTVVFADRFPFRYLVEDYNLSYYAAFSGCSSDIEASFDTVIFLANKVEALQLNSIFVLEGSNRKIAESVKENFNNQKLKILEINSMQSISKEAIEGGVNYLSLMKSNFEQLKEALNGE